MSTFVKMMVFLTMFFLVTVEALMDCEPSVCSCSVTSSGGGVIDCSGQGLTETIPVYHKNAAKIAKVDFSNNELKTLDIDKLYKYIAGMLVEELDFSFNAINNVKSESGKGIDYSQGRYYETLNLSNNALTSFPSEVVPTYQYFVHFILDLSNNQLGELPGGMFAKCTNTITGFQFLARNNLISTIDDEAFQGTDLVDSVIDLRSNRLTTLSSGFKPPRGVEAIKLSGNPWNCDCDLRWIISPKSFMVNFTASDPPNCLTPAPLQGHPVFTLKANDFACPPFQTGSLRQDVPQNAAEFPLHCPASADPPDMNIKWNVFLPSANPDKPLKLSFNSDDLILDEGLLGPGVKIYCIASNNAGSLELELDVNVVNQ